MLVQSTAQWAHQPLCEPHSMLLSQPGWKFKVLGVTMQFSPLFLGKGWHSVMCQGWGLLEREGWLSGWCPEHAKGPRSPSDEDQQKKQTKEKPSGALYVAKRHYPLIVMLCFFTQPNFQWSCFHIKPKTYRPHRLEGCHLWQRTTKVLKDCSRGQMQH